MATQNNIGDMASTYLEKNGWNEWAKYVLMSLEELKKEHSRTEKQINDLELSVVQKIADLTTEIKVIKTRITQRAAAMAAVVAFLPTLGAVLYTLLK